MNKKILVLGSAIALCLAFTPLIQAGDTFTGTFDTSSTLDVDISLEEFDFGNIPAGQHSTVALNITNNGGVVATVNQKQAVKDSGVLSLVGGYSALGINEYGISFNLDGSNETDIGDIGMHLLANNFAPTMVQQYNMTVWLGPYLNAESYDNETFSADITVTAVT